jgi:hypothetical protein
MGSQRRVQVVALVVIANGLLALTLPSPSRGCNQCTTTYLCITPCTDYAAYRACQASVPAGCTFCVYHVNVPAHYPCQNFPCSAQCDYVSGCAAPSP